MGKAAKEIPYILHKSSIILLLGCYWHTEKWQRSLVFLSVTASKHCHVNSCHPNKHSVPSYILNSFFF